MVDYIALVERREGQDPACEATIKVRIGDDVVHTAPEGNGPVNAIDAAMRTRSPRRSRKPPPPSYTTTGARARRPWWHRGEGDYCVGAGGHHALRRDRGGADEGAVEVDLVVALVGDHPQPTPSTVGR
ncbi:MAG: hypothetical protein M3019_07915 [Candidatus Dormibacteraeota bacterium]|nr:hypothetical protein [Candidatus Dormibacteraeota bacterium]